jgi:hypothetical protein
MEFVMVRSGSTVTVYLDGQPVMSATDANSGEIREVRLDGSPDGWVADWLYEGVLAIPRPASATEVAAWARAGGAVHDALGGEVARRTKSTLDSTGKLTDQRRINTLFAANRSSSPTTTTYLTSSDSGYGVTISVSAFTVQFGFGQVQYNSGTITGLSYGTTPAWQVYCDDPDLRGGSVTYYATRTFSTVTAVNGRVFVGTVAGLNAGAPPSTGGGGGGCVAVESYLTPRLRAGDAVEGDAVDMWVQGSAGMVERVPVQIAFPPKDVPCVRLSTPGGAALVVGRDTPLVLRSGVEIRAEHAQGEELLVDLDGTLRWERVQVEDAGIRTVRYLSIGGGVYAAGQEPGRRIFTHNVISVKAE